MTNCDALGGTSGAPLIYYDPKTKKYHVLGMVGGNSRSYGPKIYMINGTLVDGETYFMSASYEDYNTDLRQLDALDTKFTDTQRKEFIEYFRSEKSTNEESHTKN